MASALSEFNFQRTATSSFRPPNDSNIESSMKAWDKDNMYKSSTYLMNKFNVSHKNI
jgi:hypothetical protein